jgi:hypothetical protein
MAAACALVQMATQRGGAAPLDGNKYLQVQPGKPGRTPLRESVACCAYERSANSSSGRFIYLPGVPSGFGVGASMSESRGLAVALRWRSDMCRYRLVVFRSAWPNRSWIVRMSAPVSSRWVAKQCLRVCG